MTAVAPLAPTAAVRRGTPFAGAVLGGARSMLPWLAGVVPFGITIGVTIAESSIDPLTGWATGPLVYAGSAQLVSVQLLDHGAAPALVVLTVLCINARLVVYSGSMAPHWQGTTRGFRALAAYLLIDPSYAVGADGYQRATDRRTGHAHYLGAGVTLWIAWQAALAVGILAGNIVPDAELLALVVPFYLTAEVIRVARDRPAVLAALVAAAVAVVGSSLPLHSGAVVAIAAGVAAAHLLAERDR